LFCEKSGKTLNGENFPLDIYLSESWENLSCFMVVRRLDSTLYLCVNTFLPFLLRLHGKTFSHRWAQFSLRNIHPPTCASKACKQPIGAQQERKMFFSRGLSLRPPSSRSPRKLSCALQKLSTRFFFFSIFPSLRFSTTEKEVNTFQGICVSRAKNSPSMMENFFFGWEKKRAKIFQQQKKKLRDELVKKILR
jgi:hypothetical protein